MSEIALVRPEPPGDEQGLAAIRDGVARLASTVGVFVFSHGEEVSPSANHYIWFGSHPNDEIAVVDVFSIPLRYVVVRASSETRAMQLVEAVRVVVDHVPVAVLRARVQANVQEDPAALMRLAISLTSLDPESKDIFARALASSSEAVRFQALMAAALLRSSQLLSELRSLAESEQNDTLRRLAHHAVEACSNTS